MEKIYLVDVSSLFYRAFFAIKGLSSPSGLPTNAIYGFLSMTVKLLRERKPKFVAYCFDHRESFRKEIDSTYKANRSAMPDDLICQIPYIKKISNLLGLPCFEKKGFEADDLIGSFTRIATLQGYPVVIVSGDKDFAQLITANVIMYDPMKDTEYDPNGVKEKWGVYPHQFRDYLAIVGDSSDNIPGVKGIGPKGALQLLSQFSSLEEIFANISAIANKSLAQKLSENSESAFLSQRLVTISQDVDIAADVESLRLKPVQAEQLRELLAELGFKSFESSLIGDATVAAKDTGVTTEDTTTIIEKKITAAALSEILQNNETIWGINTERGIFIGRNNELFVVEGEPRLIGKITAEKNIVWQGFDLKDLWHTLETDKPIAKWDAMIAAYVLKPALIGSFADVCQKYLAQSFPQFPSATQYYMAHLALERKLTEEIQRQDLADVFIQIEMPLIRVLYAMEKHGVLLDVPALNKQSTELKNTIQAAERKIFQTVGEEFNIGSPKQLAAILFEKMQLPTQKKTKTGFSTDNEVLEKLKNHHPICIDILEFRELMKLKSTYVDALPTLINPRTNRIHTNFRQALTTTGRLSSVNPNLQNIPIRTERGSKIRSAFIAPPGSILLSADYSQIELRILAHISHDQNLINAFNNDMDIHSATASEIFNIQVSAVTPAQRRIAKAVNFGIAYGQGVFGLAETLGISRKESTEIITNYFKKFPGVHDYMESIVAEAEKNGFVKTLFGRKRFIEELKSSNNGIKKFGERAAINAPIQGTASDIVKKAMIELFDKIDVAMILQVHDELIFEDKSDVLLANVEKISQIMTETVKLDVPLRVNLATGHNWEEAHS